MNNKVQKLYLVQKLSRSVMWVTSPDVSLRSRLSSGTPMVYPTIPRMSEKEVEASQGTRIRPARSGPRSRVMSIPSPRNPGGCPPRARKLARSYAGVILDLVPV